MKEYSANLFSNGKKYAIVVARFNHFITDRLVEGCLDTLKRHEVKDEEIE
ncbi:MAG: 6,7-dimethyl-8-ribityllumazine synthase, partial [Anaerococcus vaginalis]|nr:6,7-dimethyl-8-ribityllumazine synthase [Anaerococcus vaginalis]